MLVIDALGEHRRELRRLGSHRANLVKRFAVLAPSEDDPDRAQGWFGFLAHSSPRVQACCFSPIPAHLVHHFSPVGGGTASTALAASIVSRLSDGDPELPHGLLG